jgi:hypothetical protein
MAQRSKLFSMSVEALLKLRDDVENVLTRKAEQLRTQLSRLGGESTSHRSIELGNGRGFGCPYRPPARHQGSGRGCAGSRPRQERSFDAGALLILPSMMAIMLSRKTR